MSLPSAAGPSRQPLSLSARRRQRACDACRHKKIKCDGLQLDGHRCSPCRTQDLACTYGENQRRFYPVNQSVLELQQKLERMESLLAKLAPGADVGLLEQNLQNPGFSTSAFSSRSSPQAEDYGTAEEDEGNVTEEDEIFVDPALETVMDGVRRLSVSRTRFYGKSSGIHGVRRAMKIDPGVIVDGVPPPQYSPPDMPLRFKRPEIWMMRSWEHDSDTPTRWQRNGQYVFPEDNLIGSLVDLFFAHLNTHQPILHRPTFLADVGAGLHRRDKTFGAILLLVCALGSRFSGDPRVLLEEDRSRYCAGHKWFRQVEGLQNSSLTQPITLHEMQMNCLMLSYCQWTGQPQACWNIVGLTLRRAQDIGVHRKSFFRGHLNAVEEELWKRALWVVVSQDRHMGTALGRPLALYDDDFDLDLPTECDDEYWVTDDPEQNFKQPPGKSSYVAAFNHIIKLQRITALALRTIYVVDKSSNNVILRMMGPDWEQRMVAELDSALNKWTDSIPDELRQDVGNQDEKDRVLFDQTTSLWMLYYHAQILIHRPFIDPARKHAALAQPSLVICSTAARAGCQLIARHYRRSTAILPFIPLPMFTCAIALLLNIRNRKLHGGSLADARRDLEHVDMTLYGMAQDETRWQVAGRLGDILRELRRVVVDGDVELKSASTEGSATPATPAASDPDPCVCILAVRSDGHPHDLMASLPGCLPTSYLEEPTLPHHHQSNPALFGGGVTDPCPSLAPEGNSATTYGRTRSAFAEISPFFGQPAPSQGGDAFANGPQGFWNDLAAQTHALDMHWSAMEGVESLGPALSTDTLAMWGNGQMNIADITEWDTYVAGTLSGYDPRTVPGPSQQQQQQPN